MMFSHLCKGLALFYFALHWRGSSHVRTMIHPCPASGPNPVWSSGESRDSGSLCSGLCVVDLFFHLFALEEILHCSEALLPSILEGSITYLSGSLVRILDWCVKVHNACRLPCLASSQLEVC